MTLRFSIDKQYQVIVIDPPWPYPTFGNPTKSGRVISGAALHYDLMAADKIFAMPVREWLTPHSVLFLWATCPRLDMAMDAIKAWGLHYRGVAFVWVKTKGDGTPIGAKGPRSAIVKPASELVLAASPIAKGRPVELWDETIRQVIMAPPEEHSVKPLAVMESLERMYPTASRAEVFARQARAGWDAYRDALGAP